MSPDTVSPDTVSPGARTAGTGASTDLRPLPDGNGEVGFSGGRRRELSQVC
ncbi:MAG: hypothetical protein ACRDRI_24300 [Pseudonocardiaceae bacterium]